MRTITLESYRDAELSAIKSLRNREIQSFRPAGFNAVGYPSEIENNFEVERFVDAMHEANHHPYYDAGFKLSTSEADLIGRIVNTTADLTDKLFDKVTVPAASLFTSVDLFRLIKHVEKAKGRPMRVLELGPGSGYLGAMLGLSSTSYIAVENSSGFYLWQAHLMQKVFAHLSDYTDFAFDTPATGQVSSAHVPWWVYASAWRMETLPFEVDIIVSDAVLSEMLPMARHYAYRLAQDILSKSDVGIFLTGRPGQSIFATPESHSQESASYGFSKVIDGDLLAFTRATNVEVAVSFFLSAGIGEPTKIQYTEGDGGSSPAPLNLLSRLSIPPWPNTAPVISHAFKLLPSTLTDLSDDTAFWDYLYGNVVRPPGGN